MVGGIAGALLAAIPGVIDLLSLPRTIKRTGLMHMGINLTVVALYILNAWMRSNKPGEGLVGCLQFPLVCSLSQAGWEARWSMSTAWQLRCHPKPYLDAKTECIGLQL